MKRLTIDEAIEHCNEKTDCSECGQQHAQLAEWLEELKQYRDAEEHGLLMRLLCKVGDTVWCIEEFEDGFEYSGYKFMAMCGEFVIVTPKYSNCDFKEQLHEMERESREWDGISVDMFKKENVFLTKEEAEQALARMEEKNDK